MPKLLRFEELNVNKVARLERELGASSSTELLLQATQSQSEEPKEETEAPEDSEEQSDSGENNTDKEDSGPDDQEMASEAFNIAYESLTITKQEFSSESFGEGLRAVGGKALDLTIMLKDLGVEYAPTVWKFTSKAFVTSAVFLLRGLYHTAKFASISFEKFNGRYSKLHKQLEDLKKVFELKEDNSSQVTQYYSATHIAGNLVIGKYTDVNRNLLVYSKFLEDYFGRLGKGEVAIANTVKNIIGQMLTDSIKAPASLMNEASIEQGLTEKVIEGYRPENHNLNSFVYPATLPGNIVFIAFLPNHNLEDAEAIKQAYDDSRFILGLDSRSAAAEWKMPYLNKKQALRNIELLKELLEIANTNKKDYAELQKIKLSLQFSIKGLLNRVMSKAIKGNAEETMSMVAAKVAFLNHGYLKANNDLNILTIRIISNSIKYLEASAKTLDTKQLQD